MKPICANVVSTLKGVVRGTSSSWVSTVAGYRLYCLDGASKVASAEWIDADDDEAAIEVAKDMMNGYECEVWQGRRLVVRLDFRAGR